MSKNIRTLNEAQLCDLVTNITKQCLMESMGLDPESGEDEYGMEQDYFNSPDSVGDNAGDSYGSDVPDEEFYDDFFDNPAEEAFGDDTDSELDSYDDGGYDTLLESKEKEDLAEKQEKLFTFITENWDNHANNLIK